MEFVWKKVTEIIKGKYKQSDNIKWSLPTTKDNSFIFSSSGKYVATIEQENKIVTLWSHLQQKTKLNISQGEVQQILFSPNERYIATVLKPTKSINLTVEDTSSTTLTGKKLNNLVYIWDISGKLLARLKVNQGKVLNVTFSHNSQLLAIKGEDSTVQIWNLLEKQLAEFKLTSEIQDVNFSIDAKQLVTVSQNAKIQSWNLSGKKLTDLNIGNSKLNYARFSPNGKLLVTAEADGILRVWDISGRKLAELGSYDSNFQGVSFSYDSQRIAIKDLNEARIWELSGRQIGVFSNFKDFTPDGKYVITQNYPNAQILSIKRLDELLNEGCNWLQDYFLKHPKALEKLYVCKVHDMEMEKPVDKNLMHNIQNKLNK